MTALRTLCLLFGALAALTLGALSASPVRAAPSCHDGASGSHAPQHPDKPTKAMECCVACVAAAAPAPPPRTPVVLPVPARAAAPVALPAGLHPAPEPHPPRQTDA
jgi:hypothetical protein